MPTNSALQSPGQKLHLLRLSVGWSEQECAYRLTLAANELITAQVWIGWEQSGLNDVQNQEIGRLAGPICKLFATDKTWLMDSNTPATPSAKILPIKN
jgi:hypothetical protein